MGVFTDGEDVEYTFSTHLGQIAVIAAVEIAESTLILRDVALYPVNASRLDVGMRVILEMARTVEQLARLEGFSEVIISGKRLTGATPGRPLFLQRRIR